MLNVYLRVADELQQRPIRIAKVHAVPISRGSVPWHGPQFNLHATLLQMREDLPHRARPDKAEIAATRRYWHAGDRVRIDPRSVHVEAHRAELVDPALPLCDHLGAHHVLIERVGPPPIRDMDDAVIENNARPAHLTAPKVRPLTRYFWITQVSAMIGAIMAMAAAQIAPI